MILAGGVQDVVVTIVVINSPQVGSSMGQVELRLLSSSERWTIICEMIISSILQVRMCEQ